MALDEGDSRILFQSNAPKAQTSGVVIGGGAHGNDRTSEYLVLAIATGTDAHSDLCVSPTEEHTGDTEGGESEFAEASRGTCQHCYAIDFVNTF